MKVVHNLEFVNPLGVHECILQAVFPLRKFYKILHCANISFSEHAIAQLCRHTTSKR